MMTMKEAEALPIPEQYKDTPNIYRLTMMINSSKHRDKIMAALPMFLTKRAATEPTKTPEKEGEKHDQQ